jgi:hypothetical protein
MHTSFFTHVHSLLASICGDAAFCVHLEKERRAIDKNRRHRHEIICKRRTRTLILMHSSCGVAIARHNVRAVATRSVRLIHAFLSVDHEEKKSGIMNCNPCMELILASL